MQNSFAMHYIKGIENFADTFSRYHIEKPYTDDLDLLNFLELPSMHFVNIRTTNLLLITMEIIKESTMEDKQYQMLLSTIHINLFAKRISCEHPIMKKFYNIKDP